MLVESLRSLVMEALDGGFFEGAVHALDLAVGPRVGRFDQAVHHALFPADAVKTVRDRQELVRLGCKLHPVVRQHGMHVIGQLVQYAPLKHCRDHLLGAGGAARQRPPCWCGRWPRKCPPSIWKGLLAFFGLDLGKINVQVAAEGGD